MMKARYLMLCTVHGYKDRLLAEDYNYIDIIDKTTQELDKTSISRRNIFNFTNNSTFP